MYISDATLHIVLLCIGHVWPVDAQGQKDAKSAWEFAGGLLHKGRGGLKRVMQTFELLTLCLAFKFQGCQDLKYEYM